MGNDGPAVHLNLRVRGLGPSATLAINEHSNQLRSQGKTIYKLGLGQSPFPVPDEVVQALRDNAHQKDYLPVAGLPELQRAVAAYHRRVDGVAFAPERVLVGPGSKELMFLLQLSYYGDLLVPAPCWVSYAPQAQIIGRAVRLLPTTYEQGWRLQPDRLAEHCHEDSGRPRLLILNYPGNPDGQSYTADELEQLAAVARRYQVLLLSDEIYAPLTHDGNHRSVARYYPEGTIISSGLSKWCGAGGWRLGTFAFPQTLAWLQQAMATAASETFTSTCAPIQYAAVQAFDGSPAIDDYLVHVRRVLGALGRWATERLRQAGARILEPRGAFYLFPDFSPLRDRLAQRGITTDRQLCQHALDEVGVAFLPGEDFGMRGPDLTARLAYVDFDGASALAASAQTLPLEQPLGQSFIAAHCPQVTRAIDRLCNWLQ